MAGANLFQRGDFTLASGEHSDFKIECDALSDDDWETIAYLIAKRFGPFDHAIGVPQGGLKLSNLLNAKWATHLAKWPLLVVDDVYTTGGSMTKIFWKIYHEDEARAEQVRGVVVFARTQPVGWITPLFQMHDG